MPISGLVITLSDDARLRDAALAELSHHPAVSLGPLTGQRLPIVVETPDSDADRDVWEWLSALPGITLVNIAVVHFTDCAAQETTP